MRRTSFCIACLTALATFVACDEDPGIESYPTPKETINAGDQQPGMPSADSPEYDWELPEGWRHLDKQVRGRLATFALGPEDDALEVAVSVFPGNMGGPAANLNRWRDQMGLPPVDEAEADKMMLPLENSASIGRYVLIDGETVLDGSEPEAAVMFASMIPETDETWFLKATDKPNKIEEHRESLLTFSRTLPPQMKPPATQPTGDQAGAGHAAGKTHWTVPQGWAVAPDTSDIVEAAYVAGPEGKVRITITSLVADGGGMLLNINRWRDQVGLPPVRALTDQEHLLVPVSGLQGLMVVLEGTPREARPNSFLEVGVPAKTIVIMARQTEKTWFFKMTGPTQSVNDQRQAFTQLIESLHLH